MRVLLTALALALAAAAARRIDQDFEFDDDADGATRRPRRYLYDPHSPLCRALVCARREECLLRDAGTALCADRARLLRNGDVVVNANESEAGRDKEAEWQDDVFYEAAPEREPDLPEREPDRPERPGRCVGCGSVPRAQFLCGSDNRTYSSLCRLDLHNCVRRPAKPVSLACRGFCPCAAPAPPARPSPPARPRPRARARPRADHHDHDARDEHDRTEPYIVAWSAVKGRDLRLNRIRPFHPIQEWRRRGRRRGRRPGAIRDNAIPTRRRPAAESESCALDKMADRLLDWFSVLMDEAGASPPDRHGFPRDCKPETRWMFVHLDTDSDGLLSSAELYALRHDDRERCLRPFLASCGAEGGEGEEAAGGVPRAAWCGCLRRAARPCTALARAHGAAPGAYVPACDARGYYRPRQCHAALGVCWCVDAHGQELPGSRGKGAPACPGEKLSANAISLSNETGEEAQEAAEAHAHRTHDAHDAHDAGGAPADDEDALAPGSGDSELRF